MENDPPYAADEGRSKRGRLMGKLFGSKDKKAAESLNAAAVDAFLHSSADNLNVTHPPPPPPPTSLPKLDTSITRYPQALAVNHQAQQNRPLALGQTQHQSSYSRKSPRPNKKGLIVRFVDTYPDIIGEGGDECETMVKDLRRHKPSQPPFQPVPPPHRKQPSSATNPLPSAASSGPVIDVEDFQPRPLGRTQTGFSSIHEPESDNATGPPGPPPRSERRLQNQNNTLRPGKSSSARFLETTGRHDENRRSFIEIHQAEMREAEGRAFARASRTASTAVNQDWEEGARPPLDSINDSPQSVRVRPSTPEAPIRRRPADASPTPSAHSTSSSVYPPSNQSYVVSPQSSVVSHNEVFAPPPSQSASTTLQEAIATAADDGLSCFVTRTRHLSELFRLHAESVKPLTACSPKDFARAGLWWFLRGRMGLEMAVRERPGSSQAKQQNELDRQQAYSHLAKSYWLVEEVIPEISSSQGKQPESEVAEVVQSLISALKKLSASMQKNGFLPPEEPFLPQTIDKSIWIEYPSLSHDMIALLSGNWGSGMTAVQHPMSTLHLLDAFPVGDTPENFSYGRVLADVYLMEQGREAQRHHFPSLLSMVRPQGQTGLVFVIASQNGQLQLAIQENRNAGPIWDDIRWRNETCTIEVKLPRGFVLLVQLAQLDYRMLWGMYDFGRKVNSYLYPRRDEVVVFRNTLRAFQYMDADPQSRAFPKDATPQCDVALFEKIQPEHGPSGTRNWHCGFRIAAVTGPRTRTLSGVHHVFPPTLPIQFGFFRGENDAPTLSIRYEDGRQRGRMVFSFNDEKERVKFHSLLTGNLISHDEAIVFDAPSKGFMVAQSLREPSGMAPFSHMPWKAVRVVNEETGGVGDLPSTILADKLRIILEYQHGTVTDRVNVAPGELRMRLEVSNAKVIRLLRQPQQDLSIAVSESQVPKELPRNMSDALQLVRHNQTIRTFEFTNLKDLHKFQAAITGFEVLFDAIAATFAITRRRMVVPIHKRWEAGFTRIQVVRHADKQVQLLAFFEDFHYGHYMNFVLKGTDIYEGFHRSGKSGIRFVDAKFPLPRVPADKDGDYDDMAFACLDLPDLPGEHDDINILFEIEDDRDRLCQCLPAPVKGSSRMSTRLK